MSATWFKDWMHRNELTVVGIAAALQIHPQTIYRFLNGKPVQRSTKAALERYVRDHSPPTRVAASG